MMRKDKLVAVRLAGAMASRLRGVARKRCLTMSEALREAVRNYVRSAARSKEFLDGCARVERGGDPGRA